MADLVKVDDLRAGYLQVLKHLIANGRPAAPRGQATTEIVDLTLEVASPVDSVPVGVGRSLNLAIGMAETCHLIGGFSDAAQMTSVTENFRPFVQSEVLAGAYGPRLWGQLPWAVEQLAADPDTRQALVTIWDPRKDELPDIADRPCTVALQFKVREGRLLLHTTMRSNDAWLGLPYDAWMFTRLQCAVAWSLGRCVGPYTHTAGSFHLYDRDRKKVDDLHTPRAASRVPTTPRKSASAWLHGQPHPTSPTEAVRRWRMVSLAAEAAGRGAGDVALAQWYATGLDEHASGNMVCERCRYALPPKRFVPKTRLCRACKAGVTQVEYDRK